MSFSSIQRPAGSRVILRRMGAGFAAALLCAVLTLTASSPASAQAGARVTAGSPASTIADRHSTVRHSRVTLSTGITLDVAEVGSADGEPVLFLHGLTDSWFAWSPVLDRLPEGVRAIVPSQRGHGDSDRPDCCYRMTDFAADAMALLDALEIGSATVVGHSLGSFIAQRIAIDHPARVHALVLVGSGETPGNELVAEFSAFALELTDPVDRAFIREFQESTAIQPLPPEFLNGVVAESAKLPARVWQGALAGLMSSGLEREQGRIGASTLLVSGELDEIWPPAEQDALVRSIPDARLVRYADTGHAPHWEMPDQFVRDLAAFIAAERGGSRR